MSPFLQRKTPDSTRSPQQWFRPASNQSVPTLAKSQHPNRALGFSSIKQLARSSRIPISTHAAGTESPPIHQLRSQSSLYGTLRDQCTPPGSSKSSRNNPTHTRNHGHHSHNSSNVSIIPDQSGLTNASSDPTTPSPAARKPFYELDATSPPQLKDMGQWQSTVVRKPLSIKAKQSLATIRPDSRPQQQEDAIVKSSPLPTFGVNTHANASLTVKVPRRRSSLTAIHLDSSHFETLDPKHPNLQPRASTLTEPGHRPSGLAESIRPVISNSGSLAVTPQLSQARDTLSPPLLSPAPSNPRVSIVSSYSQTDNLRTSPGPSHIHLPRTFPKGPVPISAPLLTIVHMECYQGHKRMVASANKYNPVPCMVCKQEEHDRRWRCPFCALRICGSCMAEFDRGGRDLEVIVAWLGEWKQVDEKNEEGGEGKWKENGPMRAQDFDKMRTKKIRETL